MLLTRTGLVKLVFVSMVGTMLEILGLWLGNSYNLFLALVHLFEVPCMMWFMLRKEKKAIIRVIFTGYFFVMVINAVLEILWNSFGEYGNYVFLIGISSGMVYIGVCIFQNYNKIQKGVYPLEIFLDSRCIYTYGFYDSGNCLMDPYTKKGVHIVSDALIKQLPIHLHKEVYIPYQSLGNEQGLIKVYYADCIRIQKEHNIIEEREVPVGITEEELFKGKQYEVILNERIW